MTFDRDERLGRLAGELANRVASGHSLDMAGLAQRFEVSDEDVAHCLRAVRALHTSLGEDLTTGDTLKPPALPDDYEVQGELGRGGMGIVYRVHQKSLDRDVALKVLRPGDLIFGDAIDRFEREARSLARLRHRHIVSVHEVGNADGFVYFTMDLVEGRTLSELIEAGEVTTSRAVRLLRQVASAIAYAHGRGVVHRDLKPANILVDADGDAFVVDFGLALELGGDAANTLSGQLIGTPSYMSPEQALGESGRIGEPSDIYALGAVLYECITGHAPFAGRPLAQLMHAVVAEEPVAPRKVDSSVPRDLEVICQKAMAKQPEARYATVQALAEDLERFASGQPIVARAPSRAYRLRRFVGRHRSAIVTASIAALLVTIAVWWFAVPAMLRASSITLGDRLVAEENPTGAIHAYRAAFDGTDPSAFALDLRTRFAGLLIDEAGRQHWERGTAAKREFDALLAEARHVLPTPRSWQSLDATVDQHQALEFEELRLDVLTGTRGPPVATHLSTEDRARRMSADFANPQRRCASLLAVAASDWRLVIGLPPWFGGPTFIELLRNRANLLPGSWEILQQRAVAWARPENFVNPATTPARSDLVLQLVEIFVDEASDEEVRQLASIAYHALGPFPVSIYRRKLTVSGGFSMVPVMDFGDAGRVANGLQWLRGLDRLSAHRKRVELAAESLFAERPEEPEGIEPRLTRVGSLRWLRSMTGVEFDRDDETSWTRWWQAHGQEDPRRWLIDALQWEHEPDELTPNLLLRELHDAKGNDRQVWIHNLLVLTVDDHVVPPEVDHDLAVEWERALGLVPNAELHVRLLTVAFTDGKPRPRIVGRDDVAVSMGNTTLVDSAYEVPPDVPAAYVGLRRPVFLHSGSIVMQANVRAEWSNRGARAIIHASAQRLTPHYQLTGGWRDDDSGVCVGEVRVVGARTTRLRDFPSHTTLFTLAAVDSSAATADRPWSWWREGLAQTLLKQDPSEVSDWLALCEFATVIPLPEAAQKLALEGVAYQWLNDDLRVAVRRARLMAGDESALYLPAGSHTFDQHVDIDDFWSRLAIQTSDAEIRSHALELLAASEPRPEFLATLAEATGLHNSMPATLRTRVENVTSPVATYLWTRVWVLGLGIVLSLMMALGALGLAVRGSVSRRQDAGLLLLLSAYALRHVTVQVNTFLWPPMWLSIGCCVIGVWVACLRFRGKRGWWTPAVLWTGAEIAAATGHEAAVVFLVVAAAYALVARVAVALKPPKG